MESVFFWSVFKEIKTQNAFCKLKKNPLNKELENGKKT
jgi:hypothetical protein